MYNACGEITLGLMDGKVLSRRWKIIYALNLRKLYMKILILLLFYIHLKLIKLLKQSLSTNNIWVLAKRSITFLYKILLSKYINCNFIFFVLFYFLVHNCICRYESCITAVIFHIFYKFTITFWKLYLFWTLLTFLCLFKTVSLDTLSSFIFLNLFYRSYFS